ncbi:MAG: lipoyl(octanoyl) transferase LipB [Chloroflexia bacterium]
MRIVEVRTLGRVSYREAWSLQRELAARISDGDLPEQLLLLEHPHTYTLGRSGGLNHLLASPEELAALGAEVVESDRGGDITYHGPGQLVGYPLLNLRRMGGDVHVYLRTIEQALIETLAEYGLTGEREKEYTGVWVQGRRSRRLESR